jgi:glycosyltransferase involved in cell wall biosynthesis
MAVRRWFAVRKRERVLGSWPILPGSETPPQNWPGWPESKQFSLVLTHDVESQVGVEKCRQLMELEMKLGFRSSFNFIPEGGYAAPRALLQELKGNGFEVGVHDLYHDGSLYRSRKEFSRHAEKINRYLKDWGAVGFRSGAMFHNLDWLHDLDVAYDTSTFDTDPFEPQPDGMNTIFPFWVPKPKNSNPSSNGNGNGIHQLDSPSASRSGYVELPYTLPQDSTLFLLFNERHPDIWFQKLDWIARHGGMALLNVHPDYVHFEGEARTALTFPLECYERFLRYLRERYAGRYWQPLSKDLAAFVADHKPKLRPTARRVCMLTYSYYQADARVTRYAEALAERGDTVDVLALQRSPELPARETLGNVNLVRIQPRYGKNEQSRLAYLLPVLRFLISSSTWITCQHARKPYDILHIHNVPDFLVFAAWYPKLRGAKVILDIHDIVPEFYASKFGIDGNNGSASIGLLKRIEKSSARFADRVIISNHLWLDKYANRTGANGKCAVFINNVDAQIFHPRSRTRRDEKLIILFPGGLQWHQGLDIAIDAFSRIAPQLPQAEFHIYGDGNMKPTLVAQAQQLGLAERVRFFNPLPVRQIADVMANADLGVVPKRADSFGNEAYSTKIMEFMSLGVPVVVSSTKIDRYYFNETMVRFFESGNAKAMAEAMLQVLGDGELRRSMVSNAAGYAVRNSWETRKSDYLDLVDSLMISA